MKIIFCADPVILHEPDPMFTDEVAAATHHGLPFVLLDYAALVEQDNAARAVRDIPVHPTTADGMQTAVYRGWALSARQYTQLYDALLSRGLRLLASPDAYRQSHHLPEFLPLIEAHTPRTVWTRIDGKNVNIDAIMTLLDKFAGQPVVLRDFVRTLKHYWVEACYISSSSDATAVENTIHYFMDVQRDKLVGGLVFREFVDFQIISDDLRGGKPIINEYRIVWLHGEPVATLCYWDEDHYEGIRPNPEAFRDIAQRVDNPFFVMDVARHDDGRWHILELDDAQIITLPDSADYEAIYQALAELANA